MDSACKYDFVTEYDVVVAGAGMAGVAAALASARRGLKTALVEKTILNGGLATIGSVLYYLPLSDSRHNQVTFGISEELLLTSIKYGPGDVPDWKNPEGSARYGCAFNPMSFVLGMDELLDQAGVVLWYDTLLCGTVRDESGRATAIVVENKSGRGMIKAKAFVDATGDADIAWRAGTPTVDGTNYISIWGMGYSMEAAKKAAETNDGTPLAELIGWGCSDTGAGQIPGIEPFHGIDGKEVSRFVTQSRKLALDAYKDIQKEHGRKHAFPAMLPAMVNHRMSRRIEGVYTVKTDEKFTHFEDSVGVVADWRGGHDLWCLPYRALLAKDLPGVLAAGRCLASDGEAWQVFRVIQAAAMSGESAGMAAAMAAERNITPDQLNVADLQAELKKQNFLLDMREVSELPQEVKVKA